MNKQCCRCSRKLPLSEFHEDNRTKDGLLSACRDCIKLSAKLYREANKKQLAIKQCRYRASNKERLVGYDRRYRASHKKESRAYQHKQRTQNPAQRIALNAVGNAIRDSRLVREPCEICGKSKVDGHHDDYSKPLDVHWLCRQHHTELHHGKQLVTYLNEGTL